ncbi:2Fe-2S iron-sulfur cluster-binding protein [Paeniglutamicibacter sp. NPDC091659]|uniref:2Fe-2S iron-sulfur cluster-binding protein n=1 Tax=Paeniglutamicibacter sp. NPDC091659 TaxID=3364389 RepID=UPI003802D8C0
MPTITFTQPTGEATEVTVEEGTSLMRAAVTNGIEGIVGECGGQAMCATCHVFVRPEFAGRLPDVSDDEDEMLDCTTAERTDASRLGCQIKMSAELGHIVVDVPSDQI